jgi:hypothetical protein
MPTIEQKRRSALHSRGCGCLPCSSCGRRQRFSAISITLDLNAGEIARTKKRTTRPSDQSQAEGPVPRLSTTKPVDGHFAPRTSAAVGTRRPKPIATGYEPSPESAGSLTR